MKIMQMLLYSFIIFIMDVHIEPVASGICRGFSFTKAKAKNTELATLHTEATLGCPRECSSTAGCVAFGHGQTEYSCTLYTNNVDPDREAKDIFIRKPNGCHIGYFGGMTGEIIKYRFSDGTSKTIATEGSNLISAMDYDYNSNKVCVGLTSNQIICFQAGDGSNRMVVPLPPGTQVSGLRIDGRNGEIYYVDQASDVVAKVTMTTSPTTTTTLTNSLPSGTELRDVAIDLDNGVMYFTDYGADRIWRANLDGTEAVVLATNTATILLTMTLDAAGGMLYMVDPGLEAVYSLNVNGGDLDLFHYIGGNPGLGGIGVCGGYVYTSIVRCDPGNNALRRIPTDGSGFLDFGSSSWPCVRSITLH